MTALFIIISLLNSLYLIFLFYAINYYSKNKRLFSEFIKRKYLHSIKWEFYHASIIILSVFALQFYYIFYRHDWIGSFIYGYFILSIINRIMYCISIVSFYKRIRQTIDLNMIKDEICESCIKEFKIAEQK